MGGASLLTLERSVKINTVDHQRIVSQGVLVGPPPSTQPLPVDAQEKHYYHHMLQYNYTAHYRHEI